MKAVDSCRQEGIDALLGLHITDHQMRLYMNYRLTLFPEAAAAQVSIGLQIWLCVILVPLLLFNPD